MFHFQYKTFFPIFAIMAIDYIYNLIIHQMCLLHFLYLKGEQTLINISDIVPVLASWLIFNSSPFGKVF